MIGRWPRNANGEETCNRNRAGCLTAICPMSAHLAPTLFRWGALGGLLLQSTFELRALVGGDSPLRGRMMTLQQLWIAVIRPRF